ncbi:hypothetical protein [Mesorhizobium sp. CAU 1741]|uniref:hypothetical protein n=1 Tax=Mesorhizobium sp. CAU 1741 TaxID=3140366 RepID=UPI00325AE32C
MIAIIARALGLSPLLVTAVFLALLGGGFWAWGSYQHLSGFREGQSAERIVWERDMADLRDQMAEQRRAAEAEIAAIESNYAAAKSRADRQFREFDAAIAAMESEDEANPNPPGCVCRPAIPRGLGLQLDKIGR